MTHSLHIYIDSQTKRLKIKNKRRVFLMMKSKLMATLLIVGVLASSITAFASDSSSKGVRGKSSSDGSQIVMKKGDMGKGMGLEKGEKHGEFTKGEMPEGGRPDFAKGDMGDFKKGGMGKGMGFEKGGFGLAKGNKVDLATEAKTLGIDITGLTNKEVMDKLQTARMTAEAKTLGIDITGLTNKEIMDKLQTARMTAEAKTLGIDITGLPNKEIMDKIHTARMASEKL